MTTLYSSWLLLALITATVVSGQTLQQVIDAKVTALTDLAAAATAIHQNRCADIAQGSCNVGCSVPACGNSFASEKGFHCNASFGSNTQLCGSECPGLVTNIDEATVRFAPKVDMTSPEVAAFACASKRLDTRFRSNLASGRAAAWQYIGSITGSIRTYPGQPQDRTSQRCGLYDNRIRPWFIAATSGPKDVVLVLDVSGSMSEPNSALNPGGQTRLAAMKEAVKALLDTLSNTDFIGIVVFSSSAAYVPASQTRLMRANAANVELLKDRVDLLVADGSTYMDLGFDLAFNMLAASATSEETSQCTRVVLFLTDGVATAPNAVLPAVRAGQAKLAAAIGAANGTYPAHVFTYTMGSGATPTLPKQIACEHNGVFAEIRDGENPLDEMSQYYQFLSAGISSNAVRWTTPYIDAWGLGRMVTGAVPVYDRSKSVPLLTAVVGVDIPMAEFERFADFQTVVSALITQSATCPPVTLTKCQMQHLRGSASSCSGPEWADYTLELCDSRSEVARITTCPSVSGGVNTVLCEALDASTKVSLGTSPKSNREVSCCSGCGGSGDDEGSSTVGAVVGGVIGGAVCVVAVASAIFCIKRSSAKAREERFSASTHSPAPRRRRTPPPPDIPVGGDPVVGVPVFHHQPQPMQPMHPQQPGYPQAQPAYGYPSPV